MNFNRFMETRLECDLPANSQSEVHYSKYRQRWIKTCLQCLYLSSFKNEPRSEKTGLRGFRPRPTQTGLYNHTGWLEA